MLTNVRSVRPVALTSNIRHLGTVNDLTALGWHAVNAAMQEEPDAEIARCRFLDALNDAGLSEALLTIAARVGVLPVGAPHA